MKGLILSVTVLSALTCRGFSQNTVSLTKVLDVAVANGGTVHAAGYSIADDKFLASNAGANIRIYNGATGAYENANLDNGDVVPAGLGYFAIACGPDGSIFAMESNGGALLQWDNIVDATPTTATLPAPFSRTGHVFGTGNDTFVALTGDANDGPIHIFTTTDDVSYTETDTVPAAVAISKSSMAINDDATATWAVGDVIARPIQKAVKVGGSWQDDPAWAPGTPATYQDAAVLSYDSANNILFVGKGTNVYALHGTSGAELASSAITSAFNGTAGYAGSAISSTKAGGEGNGTVWLAGRGTTASNAVLLKFTYTVTHPAAAEDWALYQ